jgi:hypothetical protein
MKTKLAMMLLTDQSSATVGATFMDTTAHRLGDPPPRPRSPHPVTNEGSWPLRTRRVFPPLDAPCSKEDFLALSWTRLAASSPGAFMHLDNKGGMIADKNGSLFELSRIQGDPPTIVWGEAPDEARHLRDATCASLGLIAGNISESEVNPPEQWPATLPPELQPELDDKSDLLSMPEHTDCSPPYTLKTQQGENSSWVASDTEAAGHLFIKDGRLPLHYLPLHRKEGAMLALAHDPTTTVQLTSQAPRPRADHPDMGNEKMEASARRTVNDAVASGAAVHAASLSGSGNTTNNDTTTPSFEIKTDNKPAVIIKMFVDAEDIQKLDIFERNSTRTRIFSTYTGDKLNVTIQACEGDRANNELDIDWTGISPTQRGVSQIEVTFDKTKNGALSQSKGCHMAVSDERSDSLTVTPMPQLQTADSNELSAFTFITNCLIAHQPNDVQCLQGLWAISMPLLEQRRVRLGAKHAQFWLRRQGERDAANSCADTLRAGRYRLGYELREGERRLQTLKLEVQELKREGGAQASPAVYALLATPPFLGAETKVLSVIIMRNTQVRCTKKKPESTTGASESQRRPAKAGSNTQQEQADHQRDRLETGKIAHRTTGVRGGAEQKQDIRLPGLQQKEWLGSSLRQHFAHQQSGEQTTVEGAQGVSSKGSWWLERQAAETTEEKASGRWSLKEQHEGGYWPLELDRSRSGSDMAANGSQLQTGCMSFLPCGY